MKIQIIYSSLSGCTKKLAEGIFDGLSTQDKSIHDLKDGTPIIDADIVLLGYWVDKGGPNKKMQAFMETVENKVVGVFSTLAYFVDTEHGNGSITNGIALLKDKNIILGSYVCNGRISQQMIDMFKKMPAGGVHSVSKQSELRWNLMKNHPTNTEIQLASERFNERITFYEQLTQHGIAYKSLI